MTKKIVFSKKAEKIYDVIIGADYNESSNSWVYTTAKHKKVSVKKPKNKIDE